MVALAALATVLSAVSAAAADCRKVWPPGYTLGFPPGMAERPPLPSFSGVCGAPFLSCFDIAPGDLRPAYLGCISRAIPKADTAEELEVYVRLLSLLPSDSPAARTWRVRIESRLDPHNPWQLQLVADYTHHLRVSGQLSACDAAARADAVVIAQGRKLADQPAAAAAILHQRTIAMHDCATGECEDRAACIRTYERFACAERGWAPRLGLPDPYPQSSCPAESVPVP